MLASGPVTLHARAKASLTDIKIVKEPVRDREIPITLIPGDGVGPEVVESVVGVLGGGHLSSPTMNS